MSRHELNTKFPKETRLRKLRLTNTLANHNKFYEMWVTKLDTGEFVLLKWWGRIGSGGQMDTDTFTSRETANSELDKVKRAKLAKGYTVEWDRVGDPVAAASTLKDRIKKVKSDELPTGTTFDHSKDEEAEEFNEVSAKRKEDAPW